MKKSNIRCGAALVPLLLLASVSLGADKEVTRCDVLVSHPKDPDRIADGVASANMDREKGIAACQAAVTKDPENARLNYQLGRVYFYDGQTDKALPHLEQAAAAGYRQAEFVLGYLFDGGLQGAENNICRTEDLWSKSARGGRLAALISYPHHVVRGNFSSCTLQVKDAEMMSFLQQAKARDLDYYQTVLVDDLIEDLNARIEKD